MFLCGQDQKIDPCGTSGASIIVCVEKAHLERKYVDDTHKKSLIGIGLIGFLLVGSFILYASRNSFFGWTTTTKKDTVLYSGLVMKSPVEEGRLWVSNLAPIDPDVDYPGYEEVILLTGDTVLLVYEETGEKVKAEDVEVGTEVLIELIKDASMTMSIPHKSQEMRL